MQIEQFLYATLFAFSVNLHYKPKIFADEEIGFKESPGWNAGRAENQVQVISFPVHLVSHVLQLTVPLEHPPRTCKRDTG